MDNFFKPCKRKNNVIMIDDGKVNSGSVKKKGKYDKRVKANGFNPSNIQDRLASMAKKPPEGNILKKFQQEPLVKFWIYVPDLHVNS